MKTAAKFALGAIACALVACGPRDASDGASAEPEVLPTAVQQSAPARPGAVSASSLPMPVGYYAVNESCGAAMKNGANGVMVTETHLEDIDGDYPLLPVTDLGDSKFKLGEAFDAVRQTGPQTFVADEGSEHERRFIWCAAGRPQ